MKTFDSEVLVVGLGPVGAVACLALARSGIDVAAIEARPEGGATDLRASTFHAATLEMLDALGAADAILARGLKAPVYQYRDRQTGEIFALDMSELADRTRFPFRLQCEQHVMSQDVIASLAHAPNVSLSFGHRLKSLTQDEKGVTAEIETAQGVLTHRARYVIGADGAASVTRKALGLAFPGFTHPEKFLCLSTTYPIETAFENLCYVNYFSDPKEWLVLLRAPTLWRILAPADEEICDEALLSDENKDAVFGRLVGEGVAVETAHRTIYRVHQRVVGQFSQGRVCLVGDAAHLNSPMGGFGMNSGIHDAMNLIAKLVAILREKADPTLLDLYDRQRRAVTHGFVQAQSIENTEMMRVGWGAVSSRRRETMRRLAVDAEARRAHLLRAAMFTSLEDAARIV